MVKDEVKLVENEETNKIGLVRLSQETGVGMKLPDETVIDLTGMDLGQAQMFEYLVKELISIRKNIG